MPADVAIRSIRRLGVRHRRVVINRQQALQKVETESADTRLALER